jgi:hypothetical protein
VVYFYFIDLKSMSSSVGILQVRLRDPFHTLMRAITESEYDLVGFNYTIPRQRQQQVILYDCYTGKCVDVSSYDVLKTDPCIELFQQYAFKPTSNIETHIKSVLGRLIISKPTASLESIERDTIRTSLTHFILRSVGLSQTGSPTSGYAIVNEVISALYRLDSPEPTHRASTTMGSSTSTSPISLNTSYLSLSMEYTVPMSHNMVSGLPSFTREMDVLMDTCKGLMLHNTLFEKRMISILSSRSVSVSDPYPVDEETESATTVLSGGDDESSVFVFTPSFLGSDVVPIQLPPPTPPPQTRSPSIRSLSTRSKRKRVWHKGEVSQDDMIDSLIRQQDDLIDVISSGDTHGLDAIVADMNNTRSKLNKEEVPDVSPPPALIDVQRKAIAIQEKITHIMSEMSTGVPPIINISSLLSDVNSLLSSLGTDTSSDVVTALEDGSYPAVVTVGASTDEEIKIELRSGSTIILTSHNPNVSHVDTETLKEALRYLDALERTDQRFIVLKTTIMREIARRMRRN